jgi:hypothetical protein
MLLDFFKSTEPVAKAATQILSFDCFIDTRNSEGGESTFRIFYIKLLLLALLPFAIVALSTLFWMVYRKIKKVAFSRVMGDNVSTVIIMLFLVHPQIVQYLYDNFNCVDVDGTYRVLNDLEIECWNGTHSFWSLFVGLPGIIVWGLGIPLFAWMLLL